MCKLLRHPLQMLGWLEGAYVSWLLLYLSRAHRIHSDLELFLSTNHHSYFQQFSRGVPVESPHYLQHSEQTALGQYYSVTLL